MSFSTARLCDLHANEEHFQIVDPVFNHFGAKLEFGGRISTLKTFEDSVSVSKRLAEKGDNRVLVIDGGGSRRCALLGAELAELAIENGWQGLVIYGCIRDSAIISTLPIGIRALHTHPLKGHKKDLGDRDLLVSFAGVNFKKDHFLYADADGIIVSDAMLS
jgi:regulator of ribonuclease activity A